MSRGPVQLAVQPAAQNVVQQAARLAVQGTAMRRVRCSKKKKNSPFGKKSGDGPLLFPNKRKLIFLNARNDSQRLFGVEKLRTY